MAIIQGFKQHCALMFFKGALLKDPDRVLVKQGENSQSAMRMEFTEANQVSKMEPTLRSYLAAAIEVAQAGLEVDFKAKAQLVFPDELLDAFADDPDLKAAFAALTLELAAGAHPQRAHDQYRERVADHQDRHAELRP